MHDHGERLLGSSARAIRYGIRKGKPPEVAHRTFPLPLQQNGASFITLTLDGKLRGCIGSLKAHQPLISDVVDNGFKAAFRDPRFEPLRADELRSGLLGLSVSVLSKAVEMTFSDEDDLLAQLRPGTDGLIIRDEIRQAVFLPSVWDSLPEGPRFLAHLKRKAGLAEDHWSDRFKAWRFITETMSSSELAEPGAIWQSGN